MSVEHFQILIEFGHIGNLSDFQKVKILKPTFKMSVQKTFKSTKVTLVLEDVNFVSLSNIPTSILGDLNMHISDFPNALTFIFLTTSPFHTTYTTASIIPYLELLITSNYKPTSNLISCIPLYDHLLLSFQLTPL